MQEGAGSEWATCPAQDLYLRQPRATATRSVDRRAAAARGRFSSRGCSRGPARVPIRQTLHVRRAFKIRLRISSPRILVDPFSNARELDRLFRDQGTLKLVYTPVTVANFEQRVTGARASLRGARGRPRVEE